MTIFERVDDCSSDGFTYDYYEHEEYDEHKKCANILVINVMYDSNIKSPYGTQIEVDFEVPVRTHLEVIPLWVEGVEEDQRFITYQSWDDSHGYAIQVIMPYTGDDTLCRVITIETTTIYAGLVHEDTKPVTIIPYITH